MLSKYFMDFRFCLHERKKHPFSKSLRPIPFLDIYFCPFSLFQSTFGFSKLCKLYILWILILKETYLFYITFATHVSIVIISCLLNSVKKNNGSMVPEYKMMFEMFAPICNIICAYVEYQYNFLL